MKGKVMNTGTGIVESTAQREPSIRCALAELERAFRVFSSLFKQQLPMPIITIQSRGRRQETLGWFWDEKWENGSGKLPEINICAESLNQSAEDICEILLHEMVHYANALEGIRDCSGNQYHNKKFKMRCAEIDLGCRKVKYRGWAKTFLTESLYLLIKEVNLDEEAFQMFRREESVKKKAATRMKLWECDCPVKIRAAVVLDITCNCCRKRFSFQENCNVEES